MPSNNIVLYILFDYLPAHRGRFAFRFIAVCMNDLVASHNVTDDIIMNKSIK